MLPQVDDSAQLYTSVVSMRTDKVNREAWLERLLELLRPRFTAILLPLPADISVTCGWPSRGGTASPRRVIGQCWNATASVLRRPEIFISPTLDQPLEVAHVLMHELIHAALPESGHGSAFKRAATALGLEGPMRATVPSPQLLDELPEILEQLGPYPHGRIAVTEGDFDLPRTPPPLGPARCPDNKKQGTRLLKVSCPACGYTVRVTAKWLAFGIPTCPCSTLMRFDGAGVTIATAL